MATQNTGPGNNLDNTGLFGDESPVEQDSSPVEAAPAADPAVATSPENVLNTSMIPTEPAPAPVEVAESEATSGADAPATESAPAADVIEPAPEAPVESATPEVDAGTPAPSSTPPTLEDFKNEVGWERYGYRPVAFFKTVQDAFARHGNDEDINKTDIYVSVKHGGFTEAELAAIPDDAKRKTYYLGFAKQLLDSSEGIFTKKFWTSFDGIKQVLSAGILKGEVEDISLAAGQWLLSKRTGAGTEKPTETATETDTSGTSPAPSTTPAPEGTSAPEGSSASPESAPAAATPETSAENEEKSASEPQPATETAALEGKLIEEPTSPSQEAKPAANDDEIIDVEFELAPTTDKGAESSLTSTEAPVEAPTESSAASTGTEKAVERNKTLAPDALQDIGTQVQAKLTELRETTVPKTITLTMDTDDADAITAMAALIKESKGEIRVAFDGQIKNVDDAFKALAGIDLVTPQHAIEFKKAQEKGLEKISGLIESHLELEKNMKAFGERSLPESIKEAIGHSISELGGVRAELEKAREMIANARRTAPAAKAAPDGASPSGSEPKIEVKTGSVMEAMPRLGKDLTINPRKLEAMGHAMVDANIADKKLNAQYKAVMSEFVRSYVRTFSNIRKEIYQSRMDGKTLDEMQTERLRYLADELGQEAKVSDLVQLDYGKLNQPFTEELDSRFRRVIDASRFQKVLTQMKAEFAAALTKELDKKPGTADTDETYVAFKREKLEMTKGFAKYEEIERKVEEAKELKDWARSLPIKDLKEAMKWDFLTSDQRNAVQEAIVWKREERARKIEARNAQGAA